MNKIKGFLDTPDAKCPEVKKEDMPAYVLAKANKEVDRLGNINAYLVFLVVMEFIAIVFLAILCFK